MNRVSYSSNHDGSSLLTVLSVILLQVSYVHLRMLLGNAGDKSFFIDFLVIVIPLLATLTLLSSHLPALATFVFNLCLGCMTMKKLRESTSPCKQHVKDDNKTRRKSYLDLFRGSIMLMTCLCILAVDFEVFPRHLAKTETLGISLMDIGGGAIVISSALTSPEARGISPCSLKPGKNAYYLLFLGVGRVLMLHLIGYEEHTSENGVHWNFFFTLLFVQYASQFCNWCFSSQEYRNYFLSGGAVVMLTAHQVALSTTDLQHYILSAPRTSFISCNREGIFSLACYLPLFILSQNLSKTFIFTRTEAPTGSRVLGRSEPMEEISARLRLRSALTWVVGASAVCLVVSSRCLGAPSRRLANMGFSSTLALLTSTQLWAFVSVELFYLQGRGGLVAVPCLEKISTHQLYVFVFSNLCTGLVNVSFQAYSLGMLTAMAILSVYSLCICVFSYRLP